MEDNMASHVHQYIISDQNTDSPYKSWKFSTGEVRTGLTDTATGHLLNQNLQEALSIPLKRKVCVVCVNYYTEQKYTVNKLVID